MFLDDIKENIEYLSKEFEEKPWKLSNDSSNKAVSDFITKVCSVDSIEIFFKSIFYSNLLEQFWSLFLLVKDEFGIKNEVSLKQNFQEMIAGLPHNENEKLSDISNDIFQSMTSLDINQAIQHSDEEVCQYELGCIGGASINSIAVVKTNKFLTMLSRPQLDHVWPKSRTPDSYEPENIDTESMILCEYHNKNKMISMRSHVFKKLL